MEISQNQQDSILNLCSGMTLLELGDWTRCPTVLSGLSHSVMLFLPKDKATSVLASLDMRSMIHTGPCTDHGTTILPLSPESPNPSETPILLLGRAVAVLRHRQECCQGQAHSEEEPGPAGLAAGAWLGSRLGSDIKLQAMSLQRAQLKMHAEAELKAQAHNRDEIHLRLLAAVTS